MHVSINFVQQARGKIASHVEQKMIIVRLNMQKRKTIINILGDNVCMLHLPLCRTRYTVHPPPLRTQIGSKKNPNRANPASERCEYNVFQIL